MDKLILMLGPKAKKLKTFFTNYDLVYSDEPICANAVRRLRPDWIVSFGYRHIIRPDVISVMRRDSIINCHPSLLPYGRGANPNYWSWRLGEPQGVSIHAVDAGLDTGPVFAQREVNFKAPGELTLSQTYEALEHELVDLFKTVWPRIESGTLKPLPQDTSKGMSYHTTRELPFLANGWETTIREVLGYD